MKPVPLIVQAATPADVRRAVLTARARGNVFGVGHAIAAPAVMGLAA